MMIAAIKCDLCGFSHEIKETVGSTKKIPKLWGTLYASVRIAGLTHKEMSEDKYKEQKKKLKANIQNQHIYPKCVRGIELGEINFGAVKSDCLIAPKK